MANYIIVDDEEMARERLKSALHEADPQISPKLFSGMREALEFAAENTVDVAFLDIHLSGSLGTDLAKKLKTMYPQCNIVFCTGYDEYMGEAFSLSASDYLMKPITTEKIVRALNNLRNPLVQHRQQNGLFFQCFGFFEVFYNGKPVVFKRKKAKELLAFLVHRCGSSCTKREIMASIWEEDNDNYYGVVKKNLLDTMKELGCAKAIVKSRDMLAVDPAACSCDYYDWLESRPEGISAYNGEYMSQFSWGEYTNEYIRTRKTFSKEG